MATRRVQVKSIYLVGGGDEFMVKETAAGLAGKLAPKNADEFGIEIIEGGAQNNEEALKVLRRLHEAINTVGFFGGKKLVWLKNTHLLSDQPVPRVSQAVTDGLAELNAQLKRGLPDSVRLLVSAVGCDRRRSLYKTFEKLGEVWFFDSPEEGKGHGEEEIEDFIEEKLRHEGKTATAEALGAFRERVAPDLREISGELEKLFLYVGKRREINRADIGSICSASRQAVIWELTDALGERHLPRAMIALENLLASGEQPIGILMLLTSQLRLMLLAKDLMERKVLDARDGRGGGFEFVKTFQRLPEQHTSHLPRTKQGALPNPWRLYRCALAAKRFSSAEIIRAMDFLLEANRQLVSTQLDGRLVLDQAISKIIIGHS